MKTHTFNITARLLVLFVTILAFVPAIAQDNRQFAIYNYRNDGDINAFLYFEIDSITYSCIDTLGVEHEYVVVQEIWTPDKVYRIPLENIDSISFRTPSLEMTEDLTYNRWTNVSVSEIEKNLQESCNNDDCDIDALVSVLNTNENVEQTYSSVDSLSLIVRYKDNNVISVYPIHLLKDPFDEDESQESPSAAPRRAKAAPSYRKTGKNGVVAVFNYFSNQMTRNTQNRMLEYMMQDLNNHDYGVEYYPYEDMTVNNLRYVKSKSENYTAVIIISHGFTNGDFSYFVIGEEYDENNHNADYRLFIEDEASQTEGVSFGTRFWNEGFGAIDFNTRYDCAINVNKMELNSNVILYMGACDAYQNSNSKHGTCVGWSGANATAQAHVAVLFYNLMRGKTLAESLDEKDEQSPYYSIVGHQFDTWDRDPITKAKMEHQFRGKYAYSTSFDPPHLSPVSEYFRSGHCYLQSDNYNGPLFLKNKEIKLDISMSDDMGLNPDIYPQKIYIKVTPLRSDAYPKIYSTKKKDAGKYKYLKISLPENGVYIIKAATDEEFANEILIKTPLIFVKAKPFKENGVEWDEPIETETFTINGVSFDMIAVEGGTFWMGAIDGEYAGVDERPRHQVALSNYSIGQTEVTNELWEAVMGNNPSYYTGANYPVGNVSWYDCQSFISKLNAMTGKSFRLPTEAEWEFAARGGNLSLGYVYAGSNDIDAVAWYSINCGNTLHPVAQKQPNELGLYDMSGNVGEWCQDWYSDNYYGDSPFHNPCNNSEASARVIRGGNYAGTDWNCRVAFRGDQSPNIHSSNFGLRLALSDGDGSPVGYLSCPDDRHPHLIDLGLPSGTKWACCNVDDDATKQSPTNYGSYYAWGETETKSTYDESTYKYYQNGYYVNLGSDIAGTQYDVAHVQWGGSWVMPSVEQINELREKCTYVETKLNGISVWQIIGSNGGTVFLPAAGSRWGAVLDDAGSHCYYWSSSLCPKDLDLAYDYGFSTGYNDLSCHGCDRISGHSVRPVMNPSGKPNIVDGGNPSDGDGKPDGPGPDADDQGDL